METRRQTRKTVFAIRSLLDFFQRILNHRVNLDDVLLDVVLRELEQLTFGTLHQGVDVGRLVERCRLELACIVDQLACQRLLGDDFRMILDVGRRAHLARQSGDVIGTAHLFDHTIALQTVGHRQHVDRFLVECQFLDGSKDQLVLVVVERFGLQQVGDYRVGVLFEHKGT